MMIKNQPQLIQKFLNQTNIKTVFHTVFIGLLIGFKPYDSVAQDPTLWVVDDVTRRVYELTLTSGKPALISSFPTVKNAKSSIAVDRSDNTLWGLTEKPGLVVNFSKTGDLLAIFDFEAKYPGREPEGVAVDFFNDTLWVVDDPVVSKPNGPRIYNFTKSGQLIDSFATAVYDPASVSPQSITVDPLNGTLWLTDNTTDRIYNITTVGQLIKSVSTRKLNPRAEQPQGISIDDRNGSVWITDRNDHVYNVRISESGGLTQLGYFLTTSYDSTSGNPTGVAFDSGSTETVPPPPAPSHTNNIGFVNLRDLLEETIQNPNTPVAVADALENTVLGYVQLAFEEFLKGDPDDVAEKIEFAIADLETIANVYRYDTDTLQSELVCLSLAQTFGVIRRVRSIVNPQDANLTDGEWYYDRAVEEWRDSDFPRAAKYTRRAADKIEHPNFSGDYCPAEPSSRYQLQLCEIQTVHSDVSDFIAISNNDSDKLAFKEARSLLRSGMEKLTAADVRSAAKRFRDAARRLDDVANINVTSQLALLAKQVSGLLTLYLDDASLSGHNPAGVDDAYDYFDMGETARKNRQYVKALNRYKSAATLARP